MLQFLQRHGTKREAILLVSLNLTLIQLIKTGLKIVNIFWPIMIPSLQMCLEK